VTGDRAERIGVVGGGISGLACCHFLAEAGADVTLFEATSQFGGVASQFNYQDAAYDRFYHVLLPTDDHLLTLVEELGLAGDVYWQETSLGFVYERELYSLGSPADLLRFRPVPYIDRIRLGLTALWAGHVARPGPLDNITAADWLMRLSGRRAFDRLWRPLLEAKFGSAYSRIPALWYWASFNREKGTGKEVKGYLSGGYQRITDRLVASLADRGVRLLSGQPISQLDLDDRHRVVVKIGEESEVFDRLVLCTPFATVHGLTDGGRIESWLDDSHRELDYQGALNVVVMLRRPITNHYWVAVVNSDVPFQGIVETTRVLDLADSGGNHLAYLLNYVHRTDPLFSRDEESLKGEYVDALLSLFPDLSEDDVVDSFVFRTPFVEPIWTTGYGSRRPPVELVPERVYLATTAHVYPKVTSWNSSIEVARQAVDQVLSARAHRDLGKATPLPATALASAPAG
jgi:protoporphyrinogen oxidase